MRVEVERLENGNVTIRFAWYKDGRKGKHKIENASLSAARDELIAIAERSGRVGITPASS